jgi:hypothetical protein
MFGTLNLDLVKSYQHDLRSEADRRRLATKANRANAKKQSGQTRRVFGLRLSPAL